MKSVGCMLYIYLYYILLAIFNFFNSLKKLVDSIVNVGCFCSSSNGNHSGAYWSLARMSVSGYRGRRFEPRQQYVVSLSKML